MSETPAEVVVDASAAVRGITTDGDAARLFDSVVAGTTVGHAPALIVAEVASALSLAVRMERRALADALALLRVLTECPIRLHEVTFLAPAALEIAATTRVSAYDAFYAVLARSLEVPLVTSDRRLADAVPGSMLVE